MEHEDASIRELYFQIIKSEFDAASLGKIETWIKENHYKEFLIEIADKLGGQQTDKLEQYHSFELYGLSRVLDVLTMGFQLKHNSQLINSLDAFGLSDYYRFIDFLGLETKNPTGFNPFYHEIVRAVPGKDSFRISNYLFEPIMMDKLLIKRGGVEIFLNPKEYNLGKINSSVLYWAFKRQNRETDDLSKGWGSSSQWRTRFRFDFELEDRFIFNHDGEADLYAPNEETKMKLVEDELRVIDAIELLTHRHLILSNINDKSLFPYDYRFETKKVD